MAEYCPDLSAKAVNARLKESLEALRLAEKNAVLWFAEVMRRKLYRDLGYSSIHQYAELELGFKKARTSQFIRLSEALRELPKLRESVARGEVSWTKAREVSAVATRKTETAWIAEAQKSTSRELERKVAITRGRARAMRSGSDAQAEMMTTGASTSRPHRTASENVVRLDFEPPTEVPMDLHYRLSPAQFARYEALVEKLRKLGIKGSSDELLLECLEIAVEAKAAKRKEGVAARREAATVKNGGGKKKPGTGDPEEWGGEAGSSDRPGQVGQLDHSAFPRGNSATATAISAGVGAGITSTPYQVTVWMCEGCGATTVETSRGPKKLAPAALKAILCDAMVRKRGKRNRSVLPERIRRQVMERDRMRCRGAGCNRTRFLSVHHLHPKGVGGSHDLDNLVTLCEGCHQAAHRHSHPPSLREIKGKHPADRVSEPMCRYAMGSAV